MFRNLPSLHTICAIFRFKDTRGYTRRAHQMKYLTEGRFDKAWGGVARLEWRNRFFTLGMHERGLGLEHVSEWMHEAPARMGEPFGRELARQ